LNVIRPKKAVAANSMKELEPHYRTPIADPGAVGEIVRLRSELTASRRRLGAQNRRGWPYGTPDAPLLPATLPGGKPWPKISVVTPSFNQGGYIEQTILSIINQEYPNLEYLLIDGGSSDETMKIVDRYRDRIGFVVSEKDNGQSSAINKGFGRATGELMSWVNSDDMLEPGALAAMAMGFHCSGADMVAGVCNLHNNGKFLRRHLTSCPSGPFSVDDLLDVDGCLLQGQFFYQPEMFFTRDLWERAGGYVEEALFYSMDYDLWLRFAEQGARLHVIGHSICLFRVHEQQKTYRVENFKPELIRVRDRHLRQIGRARQGTNRVILPRPYLRMVLFNDVGDANGAGRAHQWLGTAMALAGHPVMPLAICPEPTRHSLSNDEILNAIAGCEPDLVIVGSIQSAQLDPSLIGRISQRWPTLQILHDLTPLMGMGVFEGDHAPIMAAITDWIEKLAKQRYADSPPGSATADAGGPIIIRAHYGLPVDLFKPQDRTMCRDLLGLPQDRFVILISPQPPSGSAGQGIKNLLSALETLKLPDLMVVFMGEVPAGAAGKGFETQTMEPVIEPDRLAMFYNAADLVVCPSVIDTFAHVLVEAAACGTPAIGLASPGVNEAMTDGISGRICSPEPASLVKTIASLYNDPQLRRDLSTWGRIWVENEFSLRSAYHKLFARLNELGWMQKMAYVPRISFLYDNMLQRPITYLQTGGQRLVGPTPTKATYLQLQNHLASVETERDSLRHTLHVVTQTRMWRALSVLYPAYQRIINNASIPKIFRRGLVRTGNWLARRPEEKPVQSKN
jgi:glycosyltransferase involved in cell wall biosynthesis